MRMADTLINAAMVRHPESFDRQVAFIGEVIGKLAAQQLRQCREFIGFDNCAFMEMLMALMKALNLPDGPLYIPGEQNPLSELGKELKAYIKRRTPEWTRRSEEREAQRI
tara:strand:+ start:330 stop:659 length:330 start_codon:yes stop_codon:yes gene_type:complete